MRLLLRRRVVDEASEIVDANGEVAGKAKRDADAWFFLASLIVLVSTAANTVIRGYLYLRKTLTFSTFFQALCERHKINPLTRRTIVR